MNKVKSRDELDVPVIKGMLRNVEMHGLLSNSLISRMIGRDVGCGWSGYSALLQARRELEAEGYYFKAVSRASFPHGAQRRIDEAEAIVEQQRRLRRINHTACQTMDALAAIDPCDALPKENIDSMNAIFSVAAAVCGLTCEKFIAKVKLQLPSNNPATLKQLTTMLVDVSDQNKKGSNDAQNRKR